VLLNVWMNALAFKVYSDSYRHIKPMHGYLRSR